MMDVQSSQSRIEGRRDPPTHEGEAEGVGPRDKVVRWYVGSRIDHPIDRVVGLNKCVVPRDVKPGRCQRRWDSEGHPRTNDPACHGIAEISKSVEILRPQRFSQRIRGQKRRRSNSNTMYILLSWVGLGGGKSPEVYHRVKFHDAVSNNSLEYHRCGYSIHDGTEEWMPSTLRLLSKKTLLSSSTTSPRALSTCAPIINSPSDGRGPAFLGLSPHRTTISVLVLSITSKWSVSNVPGSYVDSRSCCVVHSCLAVAAPWYFRAR